jgi:hypothetical protein
MAPERPIARDMREIQGNDEGDKGYQNEQVLAHHQSPMGIGQNNDFYKENSFHYRPDNGQLKNVTGGPRPRPTPMAPAVQQPVQLPPQAAEQAQARQPSIVQQNMNQPQVKKPVQNFNATAPANSGWQAGGWSK